MYVIAKYIAVIACNKKASRKILVNCMVELEGGVIKKIEQYCGYRVENNGIILTFKNKEKKIKNEQLIPSFFADLSFEEKTYYLENSLLAPGLINAHTHSFETLFQGAFCFDSYRDKPVKNNNMLDWLLNYKRGLLPLVVYGANRRTQINELIQDDLWRLAYRKSVYEQIKSGITYFRDQLWNFGGILEETLNENGDLDIEHIIAIDCSPSVENTFLKATNIIESKSTKNIVYEVAGTDNDLIKCLDRIVDISKNYNIGIHLHCCETKNQRKVYMNGNAIKFLYQKKVLGVKTSLAHCVHIDSSEYSILKDTGTKVVVNNRSNGYLGSGKCNMIEMMNEGIQCCYGTDGAASIGINMLSGLRETIILERIFHSNPSIMDAYDALYLATFGAAKCLGMEKIMGSIEEGKKANFFITLLQQPVYDPINTLIFSTSEEDIVSVCINGNERKVGKEIVGIDEMDINNKILKVCNYYKEMCGV